MSDALERVLRGGRHELNARFAECRLRHPELDAEAFAGFLRDTVDPVVAAVGARSSAHAAEVAEVAFDLGLELIGQHIAGPGARTSTVDEAWRRIAVATPGLVASAPRMVLIALGNAAHQLSSTPGVRTAQWLDDMARLAPCCPDADALLRLGQVAAWRSGMAHYRVGALAAARSLPEKLALAAVGAPAPAGWPEIHAGLAASPWFDPTLPAERKLSSPRVAAVAGAFRGFGGNFPEPPRVAASGDHFHLCSGTECWLLTADLFGASFHRATSDEACRTEERPSLPPELQVRAEHVSWDGRAVKVEARGEVTSAAATASTLALTWSLSHRVTLVALA